MFAKVLFGLCKKWRTDDVGFGGFFLFVMDFYPHFCHPEERGIPTSRSTKIGDFDCGVSCGALRSSG